MNDIEEATEHLEQAKGAMAAGDWPGAQFHIDRARTVVRIDERARRHDYDVDVVWQHGTRTRRELVRVFTATRTLAHDMAREHVRTHYDIGPDAGLVSTIVEL